VRARTVRPGTLLAGTVLAATLLAGLLFLGYLRVSWTVAATADGAAQARQARDMLAGNWLLHGWTLSDVSFYTTELPEYALIELIRPFGASVIHVAAAATYTLLVLAACALARGRARGAEGWCRGLLAAGIMLAPQPGYGAFVLLLSPDHVGTQVPLLLGWLLLDRAQSPPAGTSPWLPAGEMTAHTPRRPSPWGTAARALRGRRRVAPAALCLLLAWVQVADRVALVTAVLPLVIVTAVRAAGTRAAGRRPRYEIALALAAAGSVAVAWAAARLLEAAGGFAAHPLPFTLAPPAQLWTHTWLTGWGLLELYGANFLGVTGAPGLVFACLHLAGLALAAGGFAAALRRFLWPPGSAAPAAARSGSAGERCWILWAPPGAQSIQHVAQEARPARSPATREGDVTPGGTAGGPGRRRRRRPTQGRRRGPCPPADLVDSVLAVAIVANLVSYVLSTAPGTVLGTGYDAREIAAVLPLGAVLAGRVLGPALASRLPGARSLDTAAACGPGGPQGRNAMSRVARKRASSVRVSHPAETPGPGWPPMRARRLATRVTGRGKAAGRTRSGARAMAFALVLAGYAGALGYSAARPPAAAPDAALADWLAGHGLRYGLAQASANLLTLDSGARTAVAAVTVSKGHVRPLLYQSPAPAYDPGRHRATFVVTEAPAARPGAAAEVIPAAAVRATFGPPMHVYRFDGFTVAVWDVNLLTKMRG
jgi:hypothetical protein